MKTPSERQLSYQARQRERGKVLLRVWVGEATIAHLDLLRGEHFSRGEVLETLLSKAVNRRK